MATLSRIDPVNTGYNAMAGQWFKYSLIVYDSLLMTDHFSTFLFTIALDQTRSISFWTPRTFQFAYKIYITVVFLFPTLNHTRDLHQIFGSHRFVDNIKTFLSLNSNRKTIFWKYAILNENIPLQLETLKCSWKYSN